MPRPSLGIAGLVGGLVAWSAPAVAQPVDEQASTRQELAKRIRAEWERDCAQRRSKRFWRRLSEPLYVLSPGPLWSYEQGEKAWVGAEVSVMAFPLNESHVFTSETTRWLGVGAFVQGQLRSGAPGSRFALGAQASYSVLGVELGVAVRGGQDGLATVSAAHLAGFFSVGVLSLALRLDKPFATLSDGATPESELGGILGIKLPLFTNGNLFPVLSGRPLVIEQDARSAAICRREGWG